MMKSFLLATALTLISMNAMSADGFTKLECKLRGNHEVQKKKLLSSKYKTISSYFVEYTALGAVQFDLNDPGDYGYSISGFFGSSSIKFDLRRINDEEFDFLVTSRGEEIATIPFNINDTLTPDTDLLSIPEPKVSFITGESGNKRGALTVLVASCKRIR